MAETDNSRTSRLLKVLLAGWSTLLLTSQFALRPAHPTGRCPRCHRWADWAPRTWRTVAVLLKSAAPPNPHGPCIVAARPMGRSGTAVRVAKGGATWRCDCWAKSTHSHYS